MKFTFPLLLLAALAWCCQPEKTSELEANFLNPPASARPKAYHVWVNGNVDLSQLTREFEQAKALGMGGFDIWDCGVLVDPDSVLPAGPAFMGPASLEAIAHAAREARRLDLELGLTISSSWNAGGSWVQPEDAAMGLYRWDTVVSGGTAIRFKPGFPVLPDQYRRGPSLIKRGPDGLPVFYQEVALTARPEGDSVLANGELVQLAAQYQNGVLEWTPPPGTWRISRYVCTNTGQPLAIASTLSEGPMIDHFSQPATERYMNYFFDRLTSVLGPLKDSPLKYLYTDSYEVNTAVWTPGLETLFQQQNGYALLPYLPALDGLIVVDSQTTRRFLYDFRKTLSDLIIENHYRQATEMCRRQGIGFVAEAGGPGAPIHNVPFESLKALGSLTIPRGEFWNTHPQQEKLQVVKAIASSAHIYNQVFVEAESFTSVWLWQEGPAELKPLADRAMCEGLNRFVYHTFPHSPPEGGKPGWIYNFGTLINSTIGWWEESKPFHDYLGRASYLLQQGLFVGDIALYYGDQAPNFVDPKSLPAGFGYDYDALNTDVLLNRMDVKNGRWTLPHGQSYAVLVLPDQADIPAEVLAKLETLVKKGGVLVGKKPLTAPGLKGYPDSETAVKAIADRMWGPNPGGSGNASFGKGSLHWGKDLAAVLTEIGISPDVVAESASKDLDFIHRSLPEAEIYFIRNTSPAPGAFTAKFRVGSRAPEWWNPEDGSIQPLTAYQTDAQYTAVNLSLAAYGSGFVVFRKKEKPGQTFGGFTPNPQSPDEGWEKPLTGPWEVRFPYQPAIPRRVQLDSLLLWNDHPSEGIRHFSGTAIYAKDLTLTEQELAGGSIWLDMGKVHEIVKVYVNGHLAGHKVFPPYELDLSPWLKPGENRLIVEVTSLLNNALVGDAQRPEAFRQFHSNVNKLPNAWTTPWAQAPLKPSGWAGPARLIQKPGPKE